MNFLRRFLSILCAIVALTAFNGCSNKSSTPKQPSTAPMPPASPGSMSSQYPANSAVHTPVKDAITKLLADQESSQYPFLPRGTRLIHASVNHGIVTLDFNSAFNRLANMGDTTESEAQKALRHSLLGIKGVDKLRITVNGAPFQSQMTDWYTPFSIQDEKDSSEQ